MAMQSDQEFAPTQIARAVFPTAFRGYDQDAVRRYLSRLAAALEHQQEYAGLGELEARTPAHERVEELESEVENLRDEIKDLELELVQRSVDGDSTAGAHDVAEVAAPAPTDTAFDEHRAIELLGQETARVLESARSAAADILKRAEKQAAALKADAKAELEEAKRQADELVATKQAETDELVARLAAEAEATADRITTEADEHRAAVLDESSKILSEAEELAKVEQADAEERARQTVADAETLRQQVISELVAERRLGQAEMDRMTVARDRLAMSLAVARTELDEVADALVDVSNVSFETPAEPVATTPESHAAEVDELIGTLDPPTDDPETPSTGDSKTSKGSSDDTKPMNGQSGRGPGDGGQGAQNRKGQQTKKRNKRRKTSNKAQGTSTKNDPAPNKPAGTTTKKPAGATSEAGTSAKTVSASFSSGSDDFAKLRSDVDADTEPFGQQQMVTGSALLMADDAVAETVDDASDTTSSDVTAEDESTSGESAVTESTASKLKAADSEASEAEPDTATEEDSSETETDAVDADSVDPDEPIDLDKIIEMGLGTDADVGNAGPELNTPPADGEELSLVQGFTTIDLTDGDDVDLRGNTSGGADSGGDKTANAEDDDQELVHSVVVNEPQIPEEVITTVTSRTASSQPDRSRGDLLIDEKFTGRLPKEFGARDLALTRSGPNFRRQLRRALNDDQSDVLDRLRAGRGKITAEELPPFGEQIDRYLAPLRRGLAEIAQAGATAGGQSDLTQTALDNLVRQLAKYIVDKVRVPTIAVIDEAPDNDRERILEPIRSLYRDFRNVGLPDLTEDALYEAFAIGLYDSIEPSAPISWVIDPRSDPDPVCEINRQRDDVVKGVVFPSGHARPLSLPGCRCLVMLADY